MKLEGKVAFVTGGSQGIGQAIAVRLAEEGADIVLTYRTHPEGAQETLSKVEASGRKGFIVKADLGVVSDIRQMIAEGIKHFGKLDILVNDAAIEKNVPFWEVTEEDYDAVLNVNLKGVFFATQAMVQHLMETQRTGKIINISSTHEELPLPKYTSYCMSKGGIKMLTRNLAIELAPYGITINSVGPGMIETSIHADRRKDPKGLAGMVKNIPLGRLGQPHEIAPMVAYLASSDADYMTGTTVFVDGGLLWNYQEQ